MAEYSRLAKGSFTAGASQTSAIINLPFTPDFVEVWNLTNIGAGAPSSAAAICRAWWDSKASVTPSAKSAASTLVEMYNGAGTGVVVFDTIATGGISSFSAGLGQQLGANIVLGSGASAGIAKTSGTVLTVTTTAAHGLVPGNWVVFNNLTQTSTTGMQTIAGIPFEVLTTATTTTFTVGWVGNASNLTAITNASTGTAAFKQILYPELYVPGVAFPWTITLSGGVVTVNTTAAHNFVVGQEIGFRIPSVYGATQLNSLPNVLTPGSPQYFYVTTVPSSTSFTFNYSGTLTAFSVANPSFASFPGLKFAQVFAAGDVNSGGYPFSATSALYPSPTVSDNNLIGTSTTINGPAIQGSFINNTSQGFLIGSGVTQFVGGTATIVTASSVIMWHAYQHDYVNP